jgi:predicted dehydrogenase
MPRTFGVGVIGTGWVAGAHIETLQKIGGCRVVAVGSRALPRARAKIEAHGLREAEPFADLGALLAHDGLDVVVLCTPHAAHPAQTIAAARAGKHVAIEKPVALDRASLRAMLAAVRKARVQTSVCFELRWIGVVRNIRALIADGKLGQPFYGETGYFHGIGPWYPQYPWNRRKAMAGDALLTAGCHALDALIWLMGSPVVAVSAASATSKANPLRYEYDANSVAILRFASGALGKVATSIECRQPYLFPILVQGTRGSAWNDQAASLDWPGTRPGQWARIPAALPESGDVHDHPYEGQWRDFFACLRTGRRPHNDLASCAHAHDVMFAIQDAIRKRCEVRVRATPGADPVFA